jgi:hypothetical protein
VDWRTDKLTGGLVGKWIIVEVYWSTITLLSWLLNCWTVNDRRVEWLTGGRMDWWTDGLVDGWTSVFLDGWGIDRRTSERVDWWTSRLVNFWIGGLIDWRISGQIDRLVDQWTDGLLRLLNCWTVACWTGGMKWAPIRPEKFWKLVQEQELETWQLVSLKWMLNSLKRHCTGFPSYAWFCSSLEEQCAIFFPLFKWG